MEKEITPIEKFVEDVANLIVRATTPDNLQQARILIQKAETIQDEDDIKAQQQLKVEASDKAYRVIVTSLRLNRFGRAFLRGMRKRQ